MCAALSSYARACAAKGLMLWGWRKHVCSESWAPAGLLVPAVPPWLSGGGVWGDIAGASGEPAWASLLPRRSLESLSPEGGA